MLNVLVCALCLFIYPLFAVENQPFGTVIRDVIRWTTETQERAWVKPKYRTARKRAGGCGRWENYSIEMEGLDVTVQLPTTPVEHREGGFVYLWSQEPNSNALYGVSCKICPLPWPVSDHDSTRVLESLGCMIVVEQIRRNEDAHPFTCWDYTGVSLDGFLRVKGQLIIAHGYPVHLMLLWPEDRSVDNHYFFEEAVIR